MDFYKQHKETEHKVHESLYSNLTLLSAYYPTTKEFDAVFRKDMFIKNNKVAFFEVIHYLLNILNPEIIKQKLTYWPLYDIRNEPKLRSELASYINELNLMYENADIPIYQASSLISPGGFRFAKFMLKISQLVLYNHLKKSDHELPQLYRLKPHKNLCVVNKAQLCHLKIETQLIENDTKNLLQNFTAYHSEMSSKGEEITKDLTEVNKAIQNARKELNETQQEFILEHPSYPSVASLEGKLVTLENQIPQILKLKELFSSSEKLLYHISGSNLTLEHNEENFKIPSEIAHIITNKKELSLTEFFKGVTMFLERKALELQSPTNSCIEQTLQAINIQSERYHTISKQLEFQHDHMNTLLDELGVFLHDIILKNDDTALAIPFPL